MTPLPLIAHRRAARSCVGCCVCSASALCAASLLLGVAGCATWQAPGDFQRRRVARTRRDCLQARRERDGGGAERRGQPTHVRRRRQQDRRAVGMDRTPEPDTGALVAAEARIGPRLLFAARSRVVRAHAARAGGERTHRRPLRQTRIQESHPSGRNARGRAFH